MIAAGHGGNDCDGLTNTRSLRCGGGDHRAGRQTASCAEACCRDSTPLTAACPGLWHWQCGCLWFHGRDVWTVVNIALLAVPQGIIPIHKIDTVTITCVEITSYDCAVRAIREEDVGREAVLETVSHSWITIASYIPSTSE